jgi:ParB-like chromosome segregation protein Spo0J
MPVLVRENGMLIAGHGRLEAAKLESITEVPTIVARGWSKVRTADYAANGLDRARDRRILVQG